MTSKLDSAVLVVRSGGMIGLMSRRSSLWTLSRFLEGDREQAIRESWPAFGGLRCFWAWGSKNNHLQAAKLGGDGREEKEVFARNTGTGISPCLLYRIYSGYNLETN
jgi:hypothetical protein